VDDSNQHRTSRPSPNHIVWGNAHVTACNIIFIAQQNVAKVIKVGVELSSNVSAILCFHKLAMIPMHVSTFQWQLTEMTNKASHSDHKVFY